MTAPETSTATPTATVVHWRDIPAQVIVGRGRTAAKVPLPERFEQAIDRAAMKAGARETEAYLAEWRRLPAEAPPGPPAEAAATLAARLDAAYPPERLRALIDAQGRA